VQAVAFGPQGALVAATDLNHRQGTGATDGHLAVWRAATGALVASPLDLGQPGDSVGFSPSGTQLAVGVLDRGAALIVDPSSGRIRRTLQPARQRSPRAHHLACLRPGRDAGHRIVGRHRPAVERRERPNRGPPRASGAPKGWGNATFSPNGKNLIAISNDGNAFR
jgi:hypothetical protein